MMMIMRFFVATLVLIAISCAAAPASDAAAQPPSPEQQQVFVPIDQLPPQEQLAAAPLLVGAYAFVVVVLFLYLFSVARRMSAVQREIERLEVDLKRSGRA
jgi:CcmD family protein